jgi:hypothetical protein
MNKREIMLKLVKQITGQTNILTIPRIFIKIFGDIKTALLFSQLYYWFDITKEPNGWFYKSYKELNKEVYLTRKELDATRKKLEKKFDVVETTLKKVRGTPILHWRVKEDNFFKLLSELAENSDLYLLDKSDLYLLDKSINSSTKITSLDYKNNDESITSKKQADDTPKDSLSLCNASHYENLKTIGLSNSQVKKISQLRFSADYINSKIAMYDFEKKRDKANSIGWLYNAIIENWQPSKDFIKTNNIKESKKIVSEIKKTIIQKLESGEKITESEREHLTMEWQNKLIQISEQRPNKYNKKAVDYFVYYKLKP